MTERLQYVMISFSISSGITLNLYPAWCALSNDDKNKDQLVPVNSTLRI